jgi:hypothetical protein
MTNIPKKVGVVTFRDLHLFSIEMIRQLKERTACDVILYVNSREAVKSHIHLLDEGLVEDVVNWECLYSAAATASSDRRQIIARARNLEAQIKCTFNQVFMTKRDIGHGFSPGGFLHPRCPGVDELTYEQSLHGMSEQLTFWFDEIETRGLDLIVNGFKDAAVVAKSAGIPYRYLFSARQQNRAFWAEDEFLQQPGLVDRLRALTDADCGVVDLEAPYLQEILHRNRVFSGNQFVKALKKTWDMALRQAYVSLKGYKHIQSYSFIDTVASYWRGARALSNLSKPPTKTQQDLCDLEYVFYPLQTEPEQSLQWMSPECFNQLALIGSLARDLPAGVVLAVKETIHAVGRRPRDFYKQINDFKNVVLMDVKVQGIDAIKQATAVATVSGTAGMEAAIMGKPVILFGRHNGWQELEHVKLVTKEEELRPALLEVLSGRWPSESSRRDGARFRQAIIDTSFDLGTYTNVDLSSYRQEDICEAVDALLQSLKRQ